MPFVDNEGVKIYYEVEGEGPPLVLHHGLTGSLKAFKRNGYTEALKKKYKLILLDARGHGKSDKPHNPESYKLKTLVNDVTSVLDAVNVEKAHFLGYSWGGRIGLATIKYSPDRFNSIIIGGMGAFESDSEEQIKRNKLRIKSYEQGGEALIAERERNGVVVPPWRRNLILSNDFTALMAVRSVQEYVGFNDFLPSVNVPCLLYAGDLDYFHKLAENTARLIKGSVFVSLSGLDHGGGILRSEIVLPHIMSFLEKVTDTV